MYTDVYGCIIYDTYSETTLLEARAIFPDTQRDLEHAEQKDLEYSLKRIFIYSKIMWSDVSANTYSDLGND